MKYSLRSLMIVVTLVALALGAFIAWRGHEKFCEERAAFHCFNVRSLSTIPGSKHSEAEVKKLKAENALHEALMSAYWHATWRPWERFWIEDSVSSEEVAEYYWPPEQITIPVFPADHQAAP